MAPRPDRGQEGERIGVFGASRSGKSSWVKRHLKGVKRVCVFDPQDEYQGQGFTRFEAGEEVDFSRHVKRHWSGFRVAFVPTTGREDANLSSLCWYLNELQLWHRDRNRAWGKLTIVAEELNLAFSTRREARCTGFAELCSRGGGRHIELIGISQRIAEVSTRFRGNLSQKVVFRQGDSEDDERAARMLRLKPADIAALKPLEFYHATAVGDPGFDRIKFR